MPAHEATQSIRRNDAMARNDHGEGIGAAGIGDGAGTGTYPARELGVSDGLPGGDAAQFVPDPALERRARNSQRQVEIAMGVLQVMFDGAAYRSGNTAARGQRRG